MNDHKCFNKDSTASWMWQNETERSHVYKIDDYRRKKGSKTQELHSKCLLFVEGFQKGVTATSSVE